MRPPIASICAPRRAIMCCSGKSAAPLRTVHVFQISGDLRIVPSPLHGTSARTRSNFFSSFGKTCAACVVTMSASDAWRLHWCTSMYARLLSASFATSMPVARASRVSLACSISSICVVFDPVVGKDVRGSESNCEQDSRKM